MISKLHTCEGTGNQKEIQSFGGLAVDPRLIKYDSQSIDRRAREMFYNNPKT